MTPSNNGNVIVVSLIGLVALVLFGVMGLVALGRDITNVIYFIGPFIVSIIGIITTLVVVNRVETKQNIANDKIDGIAEQVNGKLDAKFAKVHSAIVENGSATNSEGL